MSTQAGSRDPNPPGLYRPELDWLRFFAFLAVFLHHSLPGDAQFYVSRGLDESLSAWIAAAVGAGAFGVDLFLGLSAYLITDLLLRERERTGAVSVKRFYIRRALRIWPLYYAFLAFALFPARFIVPHWNLGLRHTALFAVFVGNWDVALHGYPGSIADPLWSVSIEEQFYLLWPLVVALGRRRLATISILLLTLATATRLCLALAGAAHPAVWTNTLARVDPIAMGALLALARPSLASWSSLKRFFTAAMSCVLFVIASWLDGLAGFRALVTYPLVAIACLLLLLSFLDSRLLPARISRAVAYLGQISYGLYVFHLFAIVLARSAHWEVMPTLLLAFAITLVLAAGSYHLLEHPFLRLKERFTVIHSRDL